MDAITTFLSVLFEPSDLVEVRTFHKDKARNEVKQFWRPAREIPGLMVQLNFLNTEGEHNIYVGANPRIREGGKTEDVALARCLFADWDDVEPDTADELLKSGNFPAPTLLVHSGHGVHAYWRLVEPITDQHYWRAAQIQIIERGGCDAKVKDYPRVMRMPGFLNLADPLKDESTVPATILRVNAEAKYCPEEVAGPVFAEVPAAPRVPSNTQDRTANLSRATMQFLLVGASEGERNARLFSAACDMAGNGYGLDEAAALLIPKAESSGLSSTEIDGTMRSAFGSSRGPAKPEDPSGGVIGSAFQVIDKTEPAITELRAMKPTAGARPVIANIVDGKFKNSDGEHEKIRYYVPLPQIVRSIDEAMGGWPRRAGGMIFAVDEAGESPGIRWIKKADNLFAWLGQHCDIRWTGGDVNHSVNKATLLNPHSKQELFAALQDGPLINYRSIEALPHEPQIDDVYYVPFKSEPPKEGSPLQELVKRLNPETPLDRALMLAALLTPGWGGEPGARPAFVFTSLHGRGTGKTTTATVFADIWGGSISVGPKEDFDKLRGRLLGDEALSKRIALMDNIKGRLSSSDIEGLITAKVWDGWKPYVGQASRPNYLTWYFTANTPSLSKDISGRAVVIHLGDKTYNQDFIGWASQHVRAHRATIITELLGILRSDPLCDIKKRDRFNAWQSAILSRFANGNELVDLINARREQVDADDEDAEAIAESVIKLVAGNFGDHAERRIFIPTALLYKRLIEDSIIEKTFGLRGCSTYVRDRCSSGALSFLHPYKTERQRGWIYIGEKWDTSRPEPPDEAVAAG